VDLTLAQCYSTLCASYQASLNSKSALSAYTKVPQKNPPAVKVGRVLCFGREAEAPSCVRAGVATAVPIGGLRCGGHAPVKEGGWWWKRTEVRW
jgi:hypothetical protein